MYTEKEFDRQLLVIRNSELISKQLQPGGIYQIVAFKVDPGAIHCFEKVRKNFQKTKKLQNFKNF